MTSISAQPPVTATNQTAQPGRASSAHHPKSVSNRTHNFRALVIRQKPQLDGFLISVEVREIGPGPCEKSPRNSEPGLTPLINRRSREQAEAKAEMTGTPPLHVTTEGRVLVIKVNMDAYPLVAEAYDLVQSTVQAPQFTWQQCRSGTDRPPFSCDASVRGGGQPQKH